MRVDAPREEVLQALIDAGAPERFLDDGVEAEAWEMAFVPAGSPMIRTRRSYVNWQPLAN